MLSARISDICPKQISTMVHKQALHDIQTSNTIPKLCSNYSQIMHVLIQHLLTKIDNLVKKKLNSELAKKNENPSFSGATLPPLLPSLKLLRMTYWRRRNQSHCAELQRQMLVVIWLQRAEYSQSNITKAQTASRILRVIHPRQYSAEFNYK